jgi:hypothetical protein
MIERDLFGEAVAESPRDLRATYRLLGARDTTSPGCCDCQHCDWIRDRCKMLGRSIDIDLGTCAGLERRMA